MSQLLVLLCLVPICLGANSLRTSNPGPESVHYKWDTRIATRIFLWSGQFWFQGDIAMSLDFESNIVPRIRFLIDLGIRAQDIGEIFTIRQVNTKINKLLKRRAVIDDACDAEGWFVQWHLLENLFIWKIFEHEQLWRGDPMFDLCLNVNCYGYVASSIHRMWITFSATRFCNISLLSWWSFTAVTSQLLSK